MTPDERRRYDADAAREWAAHQGEHTTTCSRSRLRALGLDGESLIELARAAADRLERLGALGRIP